MVQSVLDMWFESDNDFLLLSHSKLFFSFSLDSYIEGMEIAAAFDFVFLFFETDFCKNKTTLY